MSDRVNQQLPSARPNVEVVRQVYEAFKERDLQKVFSLLAADVVITQSEEVPWGGAYEGHDGALQFFGKLTAAIQSGVVLEEFVDAGEHVVAIGRNRGSVNATGLGFDVAIAHVWAVKDGKVVEVRFYIDNPTMQAALSKQKPA